MKKKVPARTPWGEVVGYSRAVKVGRFVTISGTVASDSGGEVVGRGDVYEQTRFCIKKIESALKELGCSLSDVVRTRIFTTDIGRWKEIGKAHGEFFSKIKPATSMIEVKGLIDPDMLVEVEADAILE